MSQELLTEKFISEDIRPLIDKKIQMEYGIMIGFVFFSCLKLCLKITLWYGYLKCNE